MIKSALLYLFSSSLNKAIPFLLLPLFTFYLTPEDIAHLAIFQLVVSFSFALFGGANIVVSKMYYEVDTENYANNVSNLIIMWGFFFFAVCVAGSIVFLFSEQYIGIPFYWYMIALVIGAFMMLYQFGLTYIRTIDRPFLYFISETLLAVFSVSIFLSLIFSIGASWEDRAVSILIPNVIMALVLGIFLIKKLSLSFSINWAIIQGILALILPLVPHAISSVISNMADRIMIKNMLSEHSLGVYFVAYQVGMVVMVISDSIMKAFQPWFFKNIHSEIGRKKIVRLTYFSILAGLLLTLAYSFLSSLAYDSFLGESYAEGMIVIPAVSFGYFFFFIYQIFFLYIVHLKKTKIMAVMSPLAALANILLNLLLIPLIGISGAALATLISYVILAVVVSCYAIYGTQMPWRAFKL